MKKGLSWLLTLSMILSLFTGLTVSAGAAFDPASETPEPTAKEAFTFENGKITGYTGSDVNVVIPDAIDGVTVYGIDQAAFALDLSTDTLIESVVIPSTVTYIGEYAFDYQTMLADIYFYGDCPAMIGEELEGDDGPGNATIHYKSTYAANFYTNISFMNTEMDVDADLADPTYKSATGEATVNLTAGPNGTIDPIGEQKIALDGTMEITVTPDTDFEVKSFTVNNEEKKLNNNVYYLYHLDKDTAYYTVSVTFRSSIPEVAAQEGFSFETRDDGAWIIGYTGNGGEITLPTKYTPEGKTFAESLDVVGVAASAFNTTNGSVTGVKDGAAIAKITKITVPMGVKTIESGAFSGMGNVANGKNVEEIVFLDPDTKFVHSVPAQAFHMSSNPKLRSVTLPANLTEISSSMFYGCSVLESIIIPANVEKIGARAFWDTALKTVTFRGATPPAVEEYTEGAADYNGYPFKGCTVTVNVPFAGIDDYYTAWADMLGADNTYAGTITLASYSDGGEAPEIVTIPDFKVYDQGSDEDYIEYHVMRT